MKPEQDNDHLDPRMQQAIEEIRGIIAQHYPGAQFEITRGHDEPVNVHLVTTVAQALRPDRVDWTDASRLRSEAVAPELDLQFSRHRWFTC